MSSNLKDLKKLLWGSLRCPLACWNFSEFSHFSRSTRLKNLERNLSFISKITRSGTHKLWSIRLLNRTFFDHSSLLNHWTLFQKIIRYMAMKKSFNTFRLCSQAYFLAGRCRQQLLFYSFEQAFFYPHLRCILRNFHRNITIYLKDFCKWSLFIPVNTCR